MNGADQGIIISSRIRFARNVEGMPFPSRINKEQSTLLYSAAQQAANRLFKFGFFNMSMLSGVEKEALVERHLISKELIKNDKTGAVIISNDECMSVMINEEDHFRIQSVIKGNDLNKAYEEARRFDEELCRRVKYAYDDELGFITACPTNLGAGMRASVMLFLPALTGSARIISVIKQIQRVGLTVRGLYGEGTEADGCMYQLSNQESMSMSEEDVIELVAESANIIVQAEIAEREKLKVREGVVLKDTVCRAYGTLTNACLMGSTELLQLYSLTKLGIALGYVKADEEVLDKLVVSCQPSNLSKFAGKNLTPAERDIFRADYIRKILK